MRLPLLHYTLKMCHTLSFIFFMGHVKCWGTFKIFPRTFARTLSLVPQLELRLNHRTPRGTCSVAVSAVERSRFHNRFSQSPRRPLAGPSPG